MSALDLSGPFCACLGCSDGADAVIDHPSRGPMHVCDGHATGYEVIRRV